MVPKALPSQSDLLQLLTYDSETGKLTWNARGVELFPAKSAKRSECLCALWNSRYAGQEAFTTVNVGYRIGSIMGKNYKAHRVIWKMVYGGDPDQIDHVSGDRVDNRLENLRDVSLEVNARNRRVPSNNKSGRIGIHKWSHGGITYWVATVGPHKQAYFKSFDEAVAARRAAEVKFEFHPNHGR